MKKLFVLILALLLPLTSCSDGGAKYVDESEFQISDNDVQTVSGQDIRNCSATISSDGTKLYKHDYVIDTKAHTVSHVCTRPGCLHNGDAECYDMILDGGSGQVYLPYDGGFIYAQKNQGSDPVSLDDNCCSLMYMKDGVQKELYRNSYTNDYEKEMFGDKGSFVISFGDEEGVFCIGPNYIFKVSYGGDLLVEPLEAPDGYLYGDLFLTEDKNIMYSIYANQVALKIDLAAHTCQFLCDDADHAGMGFYFNGRIYGFANGELISWDANGGDKQTVSDIGLEDPELISDGFVGVTEDGTQLYKISTDGKERTLLLDLTDSDSYDIVGGPDMSEPFINWPEYIPNMNAVYLKMRGGCGVVPLDGGRPAVYSTELS